MTDGLLFKELIKSKKITLEEVAAVVGITRQGLEKKLTNRSEFKVSELVKLCEFLNLTEEQKQKIFFAA